MPSAAGLLSNDPAELTARARQWLDDPGLAARAGEAARAHALEHYGLERFLADWDEQIGRVVA